MTTLGETYGPVAEALEAYMDEHMWDPFGIMYAYIDGVTGRPHEREFITPIKVARRADLNPWAWWTYEDSIQNVGHYLNGLMHKYRVTGGAECLERADRAWQMVKNVYYASQVHGIGSFLRPYGGFDVMDQFMEPLGTDQAGPLFHGLYHYMKHAGEETRAEITDVMLKTLGWYEQQNFRYFYYKRFIHHWEVQWPWGMQHAGSYYLPAVWSRLIQLGLRCRRVAFVAWGATR